MKSIIFSLIICFGLFTSCEKSDIDLFDVTGPGKIEQIQASYWMYGSHVITIDNKLYALKSSSLKLQDYNNQTVTIWGNKISGYPVTGGPEYIEVTKISK